MKLIASRSLLLIFITMGLLLSLMVIQAGDPTNLFENPSLDVDVNQDGVPDCWDLGVAYPNDYYLDMVEKYDGTLSLKMETYCHPSQPGQIYLNGSGGVLRWLDVNPNTTYTLSYWVKTESPDDVSALPNTWEYDIDGTLIGQHYTYVALSSGWQRVIFTFTTYPGVVKMMVTARIWANFSEPVEGWKEGEFYTSWIDAVQIEESGAASPFHVDFPYCPGTGVSAAINIDPNTLNLKSQGQWMTCYIELPEGFDVNNIDVSTVLLDNTVYAELEPTEIGDYDGDSIIELMVKFDRQAVISHLLNKGAQHNNKVALTVSGYVYDGTPFEGKDSIRVINK